MEDEACLHSKFGYYKFKDRYTRKHYSETCQQPEVSKASKACLKRHPKACRKFVKDEICRFGAECAFRHSIQPVKSTSCKIEAKLHSLANVVSEMAKKIYNLETEFNNLKRLNTIKPVECVEVIKEPDDNQKEVFEQRKGIVDENTIKSSEESN